MRTRLVVGFAVAVLGASTLACTTAANPYAEVSEYCTAYATAVCQVSSVCQFQAGPCEAYQAAQCNQQATESQASGTRQYTPANVQSCLDKLNSAYGGNATLISAAALSDINTTCGRVFVGTGALNAPCTSNDDCAAADEICGTAPNAPALCAPATPRVLGERCTDQGDQCPNDAYCSATTSDCVLAQTTGQTCDDSTLCDSANQCLQGTCQAFGGVMAACSTLPGAALGPGNSTNCASNLFCDDYTSAVAPTPVCVNALTFARDAPDCLGIEGHSTEGSVSEGGTDAGGSGDVSSGD
jgi:hypothetical protein